MLVRHEGEPRTIPRALEANLDAIDRLGVDARARPPRRPPEVEPLLAGELAEALTLAEDAGLVFGVEHNAPSQRCSSTRAPCSKPCPACTWSGT